MKSGSIEEEIVVQSLLDMDFVFGTPETPKVAELGTLTVDDVPPVIELLGNGTVAFPSTSNWTVMAHHITTLDTWQDPGVVAVDDTFGDLTGNVEVWGPKEIDFTIPTGPGDPHIFEYRVKDAMGNEGIAKRELHISCPEPAVMCEATQLEGMGQGNVVKRSCGLLGACGMSMAFVLGGAGEGDAESMLTRVMPKLTRPQDQPIIELLGPSVVILAQGADYFACTANSPSKEVCDHGALASSAAEGDLTPQVLACAPSEPQLQMLLGEDHLFDSHGVAPCGVDTTIPGNWSLTFSVQSSKNPALVASVTRTLVITPSCDVGERLCADLSTCSMDLVCPSDILGSVSFGDILSDQDTATLEPLQLALVGPAMVEVRQGRSYVACKPGEVESGCDPGAVIVGGSSTDSQLEVLALAGSFPASSCLSQSCLGAQFSSRGLSGTGLNTSAPVGTQFTIQFAAVDSAALAIVTANRTIFISHPCEDKRHFLCDDGTCSPVECDIRDLILGLGAAAEYQQPPSLSLRGGTSLVVQYGTSSLPEIVSLLPCQSVSSRECGAVASDTWGNDISSNIRIREVTTCSNATSGDDCPACAPNQQGSGMCLPGRYKYRYEVTDSNGTYASEDRLLVITETGDLQLTLLLASRSSDGGGFVPSFEQVQKLVDALTQEESPSSMAFIGAVNAVVDLAGRQLGPFGLDGLRVQGAEARVEDGGRPVLEVKVVANLLAEDTSYESNSTVASSGLRRLLASTSQRSLSLADALGAVQTILGNSISDGQFGEALQESSATEIGSMELQSGQSSASALQTSPPVRRGLGMLVSSLSSVRQSVAALALQTGGLSEALETALAMPLHLDSPGILARSYTDLLTKYNSVVALVEDSALQAKQSMARDAELAESINGIYGELATEMEEAIVYMERRIRFLETSLEFLAGSAAEQASSCPAFESNHRGTFRVSFTAQAYRGEAAVPGNERWGIPCV